MNFLWQRHVEAARRRLVHVGVRLWSGDAIDARLRMRHWRPTLCERAANITTGRHSVAATEHQVSVHANSAASCMMSRTRERAQYAHRTSGKAMLTTLTNASVPPSRQRLSHQRITEKKKKAHEKAAQKRAHAAGVA